MRINHRPNLSSHSRTTPTCPYRARALHCENANNEPSTPFDTLRLTRINHLELFTYFQNSRTSSQLLSRDNLFPHEAHPLNCENANDTTSTVRHQRNSNII